MVDRVKYKIIIILINYFRMAKKIMTYTSHHWTFEFLLFYLLKESTRAQRLFIVGRRK